MPRHKIRVERRLFRVCKQVKSRTDGQQQLIIDLPIVLQAERKARTAENGGGIIGVKAGDRILINQTTCVARLKIGDRIKVEGTQSVLDEQIVDVGLGVAEQRLELVGTGIEPGGEVDRQVVGVQGVGVARLVRTKKMRGTPSVHDVRDPVCTASAQTAISPSVFSP